MHTQSQPAQTVALAPVLIGAAIALTAFLLGSTFTLAALRPAQPEALAAQAAPVAALPQPTVLPDVDAAETVAGAPDYARLGEANAPVKVVIFADPQCPFCKQSALGSEAQLVAEFVASGKVSLIYRHFAFLGPDSAVIAAAMECAGRQGKFWPFHERVFAEQAAENAGQADARVVGWATLAGLDLGKFETCRMDPAARARVEADAAVGRKLGVAGTPTLFVNGRRLVGALPYDMVKSAVEFALSGRP